MEKQLIIIGAGGHGKVIADIAELVARYEEIYFLDDNSRGTCFKHKIIGKIDDFIKFVNKADFIIGIGNAIIRKRIFEKLEKYEADIISLVHPSSIIANSVKIGKGSVIAAGVVINPDSVIGKGCIINTSSSVDHDSIIDDFVHIASGAHLAGNIFVGKNTWIGAGAVVKNNISIAGDCMIGAGAVVVKNIKESGVYIGVPAKKIK